MTQLPTGTVTFLFTDIEGSTQLWERYPDEARASMVRHDAIVDSVVSEHKGHIVRPRGEGDSRFAVFSRATDAVAGAVALQKALFSEPWLTPTPLKVRVALHTGEADLRDGDYYGNAVNRCARLRSAAHGGQTLLSQVTCALVGDALPAGVSLKDLGEHRLKDLAQSEHLFQIVAGGLPADFPPPRTVDLRPNNLPPERTRLVGRVGEVEAVSALLLRSEVSLLTLTGPGGTGKTRLSLQVARSLLEHFEDGVFFVPLASVDNSALVVPSIGQALGLQEGGSRGLVDLLQDFLRDRQILLVLDNFEQVLTAGSIVAQIVAAAPRVKAIVTSRSRLHVRGEREFPVPPLSLPDPARLPSLEQLTQFGAVRLFIERAVAIKPDFEVNNENAPAVAEICARLDGLPLAIELAAARIKVLPPRAMLARLQSRLKLLTGGEHDLPSRQQTLRGAIDWSYHLLSMEERTLFERLSVFTGGCSLEAAETICQDTGDRASLLAGEASGDSGPLAPLEGDVFDGLESLVDKSLLRQEEVNEEPRFLMLETIREYAQEQLLAKGESEVLRRRHAYFFLALAEEAATGLHGPQQIAWFNELEREHGNLRTALDWSLEQSDAEVALRLSGALWFFWWIRGYLSEGRRWLESALALTPSPEQPDAQRGKALYGLSILCRNLVDFAAAHDYAEESAAIFRKLGDKAGVGWALSIVALSHQAQGEPEIARAQAEESVEMFRQADDRWGLANGLLRMGMLAGNQNDLETARSSHREALSLFRRVGDKWGVSQTLNLLGDMARMESDYAEAESLYTESLSLYWELGIKRDIPASLHNLGYVALHLGNYEKAKGFFREALTLQHELGNKHGIIECLAGLAGVFGAEGDADRAARLFAVSEALRESAGMTLWPAERADYERNLAAARAQLDAHAWEHSVRQGRAMGMEEAVAYALQED